MRKFAPTVLWVYFAWYAGALAAEVVPVPGEIGLIIIATILAVRLVRQSLPALERQRERTAAR